MGQDEMSHSSQLIGEIDAAGVASIKQMAFWSGLHENTVRDYRDGRIKHFGSEMRFWNGVLVGMSAEHAPGFPGICFRVPGLLLKGTRMAVTSADLYVETKAPIHKMLRNFAPVHRDLAGAMESAADIFEDGHVDHFDDPTIAELNQKIDSGVARLMAIKAGIANERAKACARG